MLGFNSFHPVGLHLFHSLNRSNNFVCVASLNERRRNGWQAWSNTEQKRWVECVTVSNRESTAKIPSLWSRRGPISGVPDEIGQFFLVPQIQSLTANGAQSSSYRIMCVRRGRPSSGSRRRPASVWFQTSSRQLINALQLWHAIHVAAAAAVAEKLTCRKSSLQGWQGNGKVVEATFVEACFSLSSNKKFSY